MEVKVCKRCKKLFQYIAGPEYCSNCKKIEEEQFQKVKEYLRKNPGAELAVVSRETEVSTTLIEKFLREERLEVSADSPICLTCERCGKKIITGRYCAKCMNEISNELQQMKRSFVEKSKPKDEAVKMRYLKADMRK